MGKYRRKLETVQAIRWAGTAASQQEVEELIYPRAVRTSLENDDLMVETDLYGMMRAHVGDWVTMIGNSPKVVAGDIFTELFEPDPA